MLDLKALPLADLYSLGVGLDLPCTNRQTIVNTLLNNLKTLGYLLSLEVDQIFVVVEDLHIREATPSSLDFLSGKNVL